MYSSITGKRVVVKECLLRVKKTIPALTASSSEAILKDRMPVPSLRFAALASADAIPQAYAAAAIKAALYA